MATQEGNAAGIRFFLTSSKKLSRQDRVAVGLKDVQQFLEASKETGDPEKFERAVNDGIFLAMHIYALEANAQLGPNMWSAALMEDASVPGASGEDVDRALRRGLPPGAISAEEVREVVSALVAAAWGKAPFGAEQLETAPLAVSACPSYACLQISIGVLWGYALRALTMRLALDRALGTVPESANAARRRLERAFADDGGEAAASASEVDDRPSLHRYASEFFGHRDWAALCRLSDSAVGVLEGELAQATPALALLAGRLGAGLDYFDGGIRGGVKNDEISFVDWSEFSDWSDFSDDSDDEDSDDENLPEDLEDLDQLVTLSLQDWEGMQRRSIVVGALLADAEAFVDQQVGPLQRGRRRGADWVDRLIRAGALTAVRREQAAVLAVRLSLPLQRLAEALRGSLLASKLRSAREGLSRIYALRPLSGRGARAGGGESGPAPG